MTQKDHPMIEEAKCLLDSFRHEVRPHTDIIITLADPDEKSEGLKKTSLQCYGSCLHVIYEGACYILTCSHVAKKDSIWFCGPKRLQKKMIPDGEHHLTKNLIEITRNESLDVTVLKGEIDLDAIGKKPYNLALSIPLNLRNVQKGIGTACYIYGIWGEFTHSAHYNDAVSYFEVPVYEAIGPISSCCDGEITADFAEKEIIEVNCKDFPQLEGIIATGGQRDLSGCSGSGLWVKGLDGIIILAGILLGRKPGTSDQHIIRFVPVWKVLELLRDYHANTKVK
jgi:hypothetical protein